MIHDSINILKHSNQIFENLHNIGACGLHIFNIFRLF